MKNYPKAKVYNDGCHYIAIPHTERPKKRKPLKPDAETQNREEKNVRDDTIMQNADSYNPQNKTDLKELFEQLYKDNSTKKINKKVTDIAKEMNKYFKSENSAIDFVKSHMERKRKNIIVRKTRLARKVNLQEFNYFCTFTYDDKKHTEDTFRKKLKDCFKHLSNRKEWKYIGVWERSPDKNRLHFHGIFFIPERTMPGKLEKFNDYSLVTHRRQITIQNTYFNERFGRSDFEPIDDRNRLTEARAYLTKYLEKSGEKLIYSKGLPTYFVSDIMDEDVVCTIGQEDKKLLLFDDFNCWDEGCLIGKVSPEVIAVLPKSN